MNKKAIIFSYYFPPSGKASLHLPLSVIKHLPEAGIEPVLITIEEEGFAQEDKSLMQLVPKDLRVIRTRTWEPFGLYRKFTGKSENEQLVASETISKENKSFSHKLSLWLRLNLFVPDARIGWYPFGVSAGKQLIANDHIHAIITFGPPHSTHLIGARLSKLFGIPHFPIFIDPWVDIAYYSGLYRSKLTVHLDSCFERSILEKARYATFVTKSMEEEYVRKYPSLKGKTHVLYWGYNEESFANLSPVHHPGVKTLVHAGNIFDFQNPIRLWHYLKQYNATCEEKIRVQFIGTVSPAIRRSIEEYGLGKQTEFLGFLPYSEMINRISGADYLLVCVTEKRHIPGKLFEYLRTGKRILAFGADNEEVREILRKSGAGKLLGYDESPADFFSDNNPLQRDDEYISTFERQSGALNFARLLH